MSMPLKIFAGSASKSLATEVCTYLGRGLSKVLLQTFPNGESFCQFEENIRGTDVYLFQSIVSPANDRLMEVLVMIDAAKRASAERITVVLPYHAYLRQDRKDKPRVPVSAALIPRFFEVAGANRILGVDFHCGQVQGFYNIPVDHLYSLPIFFEYIRENVDTSNIVAVSPDLGGLKRAQAVASYFNCDLAIVAKTRVSATEVKAGALVGSVEGKDVVMFDDLTESCGTLIGAAKRCREGGAKSIRAFVTHGLFTEAGYQNLAEDAGRSLDEIIVTNTAPITLKNPRLKQLSIAPLLGKAISCISRSESVSELFEVKGF